MTNDQIEARADEIRQLMIRKLKMDERFAAAKNAEGALKQDDLDEYVRICRALRDAI